MTGLDYLSMVNNFNYLPIIIGIIMASLDAMTLPFIRKIHNGNFHFIWMTIPILIYAIQPMIFYKGLDTTTMTKMNLYWDLSSDILVTLIGLFILREKINKNDKFGLFFAFLAITLFSIKK